MNISKSTPTSTSTSHTTTGTTSGASSPVAAEDSQAIGSGSIGVGSGKYLESGATDYSGSRITAGTGSSVTIGDPNADSVISQLANQFASTVQSISGGSTSQAPAAPAAIPWGTIGIIAAILMIGLFLGRKS